MKIVFLLLPNTNLLDFAGATQVFQEAKALGLPLELQFCAYENEIRTSIALPLGRLDHFNQHLLQAGDYLFIVSAEIQYVLSDAFRPEQDVLEWIAGAHARGAAICAICNGAFLLGRTGLLDGKKCTTHWKRTPELQARFPKAKVQENVLFVEDHNIFTSAGASSGIDLALHILSKLKNDYFAYKVSRELLIYNRRSGHQQQHSEFINHRNHVHTGIHRVQDWLQENLHKKVLLEELAEVANMSYRNFCRIFKKETGLTVVAYLTLLRREKIKELLQNPDLSRRQIAQKCGLDSDRQLRRIMKSQTV